MCNISSKLMDGPHHTFKIEASACASKNIAHLICLISTECPTQHENAERRYKHWFCYCEWNWVIKLAPNRLTGEWMTPTPAASMAKFNLIYSVANAISAQSIKLRTLCGFYGRHQWHSRHRNDLGRNIPAWNDAIRCFDPWKLLGSQRMLCKDEWDVLSML